MADADCSTGSGTATAALAYRIGGLFGILLASAIGFSLPVICKGRFASAFFLFRTYAAGVVLATGFVHVLPDAADTLSNPCLHFSTSFPWANAVALFAALLTFIGENTIRGIIARALQRKVDLTEPEDSKEARVANWKVVAYTLEAGIIFHSIFVGITLGTSHDVHYVQGLTFALLFHQGFEGISLGAALVKAEVTLPRLLLFGAAFVLTTPIGIAIGLGAGNSYNENSETALAFEGSFNSISAGILIYNGLVDLVLPAFDPADNDVQPTGILLLIGYCSMLAGAACMTLIAKWA